MIPSPLYRADLVKFYRCSIGSDHGLFQEYVVVGLSVAGTAVDVLVYVLAHRSPIRPPALLSLNTGFNSSRSALFIRELTDGVVGCGVDLPCIPLPLIPLTKSLPRIARQLVRMRIIRRVLLINVVDYATRLERTVLFAEDLMISRLRHKRRPMLIPPGTKSPYLALIHRCRSKRRLPRRIPIKVARPTEGALHPTLVHLVLPDVPLHVT